MSPTLTNFLFEAANFLVLAAVLAWLFFRPVRDALERRQALLQRQRDEAAEKLAAAGRLQAETRQRYDQLEQELDERERQVLQAAQHEAEQILSKAREAARHETAAARQRLTQLHEAEQTHLAHVIAQTTGLTVERLLRQIAQPELEQALVAAACREIKALAGNTLAPVRIESARPLSENARADLQKSLGQAAESAEYRVVEELGTGLRVATNHGLIDASAAGLAAYARQTLEHSLATAETPNHTARYESARSTTRSTQALPDADSDADSDADPGARSDDTPSGSQPSDEAVSDV